MFTWWDRRDNFRAHMRINVTALAKISHKGKHTRKDPDFQRVLRPREKFEGDELQLNIMNDLTS